MQLKLITGTGSQVIVEDHEDWDSVKRSLELEFGPEEDEEYVINQAQLKELLNGDRRSVEIKNWNGRVLIGWILR